MAIQHASIPDGKRHEPKGISTATAKQVYVADGAASGAWAKIGPQSLSGVSSNGTAGQFVGVDGVGNFVLASSAKGSVYFYNYSTPYTLTYPSTYTKLGPTTTAKGTAVLMTEGTNARLTYTGAVAAKLDVVFSVSLDQASGAARDIELAIHKNGTLVEGSRTVITTTTGLKHSMSCHADISMATNDYVEVFAINRGGSGDVNVYAFTLAATTSGA